MKAFFERLGAFLTSLRVWTINILTLIVVVYLVVVLVAFVQQMPATVDPEGRVLILAPEGLVLDQEAFPSEFSFPFDMPDRQIQSRDLTKLIRAAAKDDRLTGVLIDFSETVFTGPSTALAIAEELAALRDAGKPVVAFSEFLTTGSYLMAAQADEIFLHPSGSVSVSGLGGYRSYTRELTEKLKINIHNYAQGEFKSAVEGLTRTDMSDADRLQREEFYGPIWTAMKANMAEARGVEAQVFQEFADDYAVALLNEAAYDNLAFAEQEGMIDGTKSFPEFRAWMIEKFGKDEEQEERETYPHIFSDQYFAQLEEEEEAEDAVAVVFVEGTIQPGEIGPGVAGSHDVADLIRRAYENENTRALVLRVNSPGGSIIASDMIRDELLTAKSRDLPVFVSMGDVAASGGMWVSTPADAIYAEPTTITGSIGVAMVFPTLENMLDHVGINFDGVTTSEHAGWGINQGVNEKLDAIFARFASSAYERFIDTVAGSRDKEHEYIRSIAGGRVWIGSRAQELGLVDELGSMEEAIAAAAGQAGLDDYRVNYVTKEPPFAFAFLQQFSAGIEITQPYGAFGRQFAHLLESLEGLNRPQATVMCAECMVELL